MAKMVTLPHKGMEIQVHSILNATQLSYMHQSLAVHFCPCQAAPQSTLQQIDWSVLY